MRKKFNVIFRNTSGGNSCIELTASEVEIINCYNIVADGVNVNMPAPIVRVQVGMNVIYNSDLVFGGA